MDPFNFIKTNISILDVVNEYTHVKKAGLYWKGMCPFHHEKDASFTVSPHKEIFYCFGCNSGGDVITFVTKVEQCSPLEAVKLLADRYHLDLPDEQKSHVDTMQQRKRYFDMCKVVAQWCHEQLRKSSSALHYVKKREIDQNHLRYFSLGYFPGGLQNINALLHAMKQHAFLAHDLIEAHILFQGKHVLYSPFENRIIFPIKDHLGRFCGFGGRTFKPEDTRAKYYNSHENSYFNKGSLLFGLDLAKKSIQKTENVFLVEGYTDCIAMVQHGFINTIATLGTACSVEHLKTLSRYCHELFVLYDGDTAGQQAIVRLTELCWHVDMELKVVCLPPGEDPASFLAKKYDLKKLTGQAKDIFDFFISRLGESFITKPLHEKLRLARRILKMLRNIDDQLKQDILLQRASAILAIPFESLQKELKNVHYPKKIAKEPQKQEQQEKNIELSPSTLENKIFFAIMNNIKLLNQDNEKYLIAYFSSPLKGILCRLRDEQQQNHDVDFLQFFDKLDATEQEEVSRLLVSYEEDIQPSEFEQLLLQFQKKKWKNIVCNVRRQLEQAKQEGKKETIAAILHDFLLLKKQMLDNTIK